MASPLTAVTEAETSISFCSRFDAVTTTSSSTASPAAHPVDARVAATSTEIAHVFFIVPSDCATSGRMAHPALCIHKIISCNVDQLETI
jgi:hypothetical protein